MAHQTNIRSLTEALVASLLPPVPHGTKSAPAVDHRLRPARDHALRVLRATGAHARANQFAVQAQLAGLEEKLFVLGRADLAGALVERVAEMEAWVGGKREREVWGVEGLALVVALAERPWVGGKVVRSAGKVEEKEEEWTWEKIVAEDPLVEEGIWSDVDFAAGSEQDEEFERILAKDGRNERREMEETKRRREEEEMMVLKKMLNECVVEIDDAEMEMLQERQLWREKEKASRPEEEDVAHRSLRSSGQLNDISELQVIREVLFMLAGLPTTFSFPYTHPLDAGEQGWTLSHATPQTFDSLISDFADVGRRLNALREWSRRTQTVSLLQTFRASVSSRITDFDKSLAQITQSFITPAERTVTSLLSLHTRITPLAEPLLHLEFLLMRISPRIPNSPFVHLQTLYDAIVLAQLTNDSTAFSFLGRIFFDCLQTYLKPLRSWMEHGELPPDSASAPVFFVRLADSSADRHSLWHSRFALRTAPDGTLHAPAFLRPAVKTIFDTGKSVVFLRALDVPRAEYAATGPEPALTLDSVCGSLALATGGDATTATTPLAPFAEAFAAAFDAWARSKYSTAAAALRDRLFGRCGLWRTLDALECVLLGRQGAAWGAFAEAVFARVDRGGDGWDDGFVLTEVARGLLGGVEGVRVEAVAVRPGEREPEGKKAWKGGREGRSVRELARIRLDYAIPWPLSAVLPAPALRTYTRLSTLLLQLYRAQSLLSPFPSLQTPAPTHNSLLLRHRLLATVLAIRSHITQTVLPPLLSTLRAGLRAAPDVDGLAAAVRGATERMEIECLLGDNVKPLREALLDMLDLCVEFAGLHVGERRGTAGPKGGGRKGRVGGRTRWGGGEAGEDGGEEGVYDADGEEASSEEEGEEGREDEEGVVVQPPPPGGVRGGEARAKEMLAEHARLLGFLVAGLRSIARTGGGGAGAGDVGGEGTRGSGLEMLGERLGALVV